MSDEVFLVCEHADALMTTPGSSFKFHCSKCNRRVMIAPSGMNVLRDRPAVAILCLGCFYGLKDAQFEGLTAEQCAELREPSIPNLWRKRN